MSRNLQHLLVTSSCKIKNRCFRFVLGLHTNMEACYFKTALSSGTRMTIAAVEMETDGTVAELHRLADL